MQNRITPEEMQAAARHLAKNERGRSALKILSDALEGEDLSLDLLDQRAFLALLGGAWHGERLRVRAIIRETLVAPPAATPH